MKNTYYFAYGSNLDQAQMKRRCPESILVGKAVLKDYKLIFSIYSPKRKSGCADVVESSGDEVWGLVYRLSSSDLERLDKYEAVPDKYNRFEGKVFKGGRLLKAQVYQVTEKSQTDIPPSKEYLGMITKAAKEFCFPEEYIKNMECLNEKAILGF